MKNFGRYEGIPTHISPYSGGWGFLFPGMGNLWGPLYQRGPTPAMQLPESSHPGTRTSRLNLDARAVSYALVWSAAFKHRAANSNNRVSRPTSHLAKIFCRTANSNNRISRPIALANSALIARVSLYGPSNKLSFGLLRSKADSNNRV